MTRTTFSLVLSMVLGGCISDAQYAKMLADYQRRLDENFPPGKIRSQLKFVDLSKPPHAIGAADQSRWGDASFIRWCVGDCVVGGRAVPSSFEELPAPEGFGLAVVVLLYDADDRLVRAYRRYLD